MRTTIFAVSLLLCSTAYAQHPMLLPIGGVYEYVDGSNIYSGDWTTDGIWSPNQDWNADVVRSINGDATIQSREDVGWITLYFDMGGVDSMSGYFDFSSIGRKYELWDGLVAPIGSTNLYLDGIPLEVDQPLWLEAGTHRLSWDRPEGGTTSARLSVRVPEPSAAVLLLLGLPLGWDTYRRTSNR